MVGGGAREHALAWRLHCDGAEVHIAPGNAGASSVATSHPVAADDIAAQVELARELSVDLVVVGPELPLVNGLVDALGEAGIKAFGPNKSAARLEGSKVFAKEVMARAGVPTAAFQVFDSADAAREYVNAEQRPLVVKADGLAAGKGVTVASNAEEACQAITEIMSERKFGNAGDKVLIEDCLNGEEVSYHVVCDGDRFVALASAQDHKRALDGDKGPNTGGMGAYSPPPVVTQEVEDKILQRVVQPTLDAMRDAGTPFRGTLFIGLMIVEGEPFVLEYNVRFGDPETEVLMARMKTSALKLFSAAAKGDLRGVELEWSAPAALCVVAASGGYPGAYEKGKRIVGLAEANAIEDVHVFHAGTAEVDGEVHTAGGRVLAVTATGSTLSAARKQAYAAVDTLCFEGIHVRRDIGWRALKK